MASDVSSESARERELRLGAMAALRLQDAGAAAAARRIASAAEVERNALLAAATAPLSDPLAASRAATMGLLPSRLLTLGGGADGLSNSERADLNAYDEAVSGQTPPPRPAPPLLLLLATGMRASSQHTLTPRCMAPRVARLPSIRLAPPTLPHPVHPCATRQVRSLELSQQRRRGLLVDLESMQHEVRTRESRCVPRS